MPTPKSAPMALIDDYSSDIFTSAFLPIGSTIKASLDYGHDEDWFKVTLQKGTTYLFSRPQDSAQDEIGQDGLFMELRDANGQVLTDSYGRGSMPIVQFTADRTGDYFLTARRAEIVQYIEKASYILWAGIQAPDAIPSDISSTAVLPAGGSVYGQFEVAGDRDWYKFHAEGGKFYGWRSSAPAGSDSVFMDFEVYDGNGKLVDQYYPLEPAVSGDYFVSVQGLAGSYNFTSVERVDDYAINDQATTGTLLLEKTVKGAIQYISDEDSFKLSAKAGEYYQVVLNADRLDIRRLELTSSATSNTADFYFVRSYTGLVTATIHAKVTGDIFLHVEEVNPNTQKWVGPYSLTTTLIGDTFAPAVSTKPSTYLAVDLYNDIVLSFDEPFKLVSGGTFTIRDFNNNPVVLTGGQPRVVGNSLVFDPVEALQLGTSYTLTLSPGSLTDFLGNAIGPHNTYYFSTAKFSIVGTSHYNELTASGSGSIVSGLEGRDTVSYSLTASMYTIHRENDYVAVTRNGSASGDRLTSIERLHFADADIALDINGNGGQAYRMYQAALNRSPEKDGVGYWIAQLDKGVSLHTVAQGFINSPEFSSLYGPAPSNAAFVDLLYHNVLHRNGDQEGIHYWNQKLDSGTTRAQVLIGFSESPENQAALIGQIGDGFSYTLHR